VTHLILGLGNPGREYAATRHNAGFRVIVELARRLGLRLDREDCNALTARASLAPTEPLTPSAQPTAGDGPSPAGPSPAAVAAAPGMAVGAGQAEPRDATAATPAVAAQSPATAVLLAMPQTYMNRSGYAARCLIERHGIAPEAVLVVYDEVNLPLGRVRLRRSGSPAGHRGIESILENLRSDQIARLRIGVGVGGSAGEAVAGEDLVAFVLSPFAVAEEEALVPVIERAADACEVWWREGIETAMNRFNGS
jgi:peptidyl-tRNA hydrolase, PTH1 family